MQQSVEYVRMIRVACLAVILWSCLGGAAFAHDVPASATLLMYVKPEAGRLSVLLRVPMATLSEIQFPVRGPGYLDLDNAGESLREAVRVYLSDSLRFFVDGGNMGEPELLRARVTLPSNMAFITYDSALEHVNSPPLTNDIDLFWNQASLDVLLAYRMPAAAAGPGSIALRAPTDRLSEETLTVLRYLTPDGTERVYNYTGNPGLIQLDPGWWHAVSRFVVLGFSHILEGVDHLLFLFALMIPMRSVRALVLVVTSFTIAHTITLISSALGLLPTALWFPTLIETLIALSVLYMAFENIFGARQETRWMVAFGFGLVHGFGFSFILADRMQFAGAHLISSLLAFNVGVELGQLLVLVLVVPVLWLFFRYGLRDAARERLGVILLSALVAHSAWHWLTERGAELARYSWQWPMLNAAFFAGATRWAMVLIGSALVLLLMQEVVIRLRR